MKFLKNNFQKENYQRRKDKVMISLEIISENHEELLCEESVEEKMIRKFTNEKLLNVVEKLPDKQRRRIKMRYLEDLTIFEIAKIEKCGENKVQNSIFRALKKLKDDIKKLF